MSYKPLYPVGVSVLLTRGNQVLLGKRKSVSAEGLYSTPGGRIEMDEMLLQCAKREALEEAGIVLGHVEVLGFREHLRFDQHYFMVYVRCENWTGEIVNNEPDKCEGWQWFDVDKIPENCTEPNDIIASLELLPKVSVK